MGFFSVKTIDSIVSGVTALIEDLHVVAEAHAAEANLHAKIVQEAAAAEAFATQEYNRAKAIAANFEKLLGG